MSSPNRKARRAAKAAAKSKAGAIPTPTENSSYEHAADFLKNLSGFDGANQSDRRSWIYWPTLDTKRELSSYSRTELLRKSRALRANSGLPNRICSGLADLIGYLQPVAISGDKAWDKLADAHWEDRAGEAMVIDASGSFGIRQMQIELVKAAFGDGDILPVLIKGSTGGIMLANYEAHQLANPAGTNYASKEWIDGVRINKFRRHLAYGLKDDDGKVSEISANDALYFAFKDALGRIRPPTILAHAVNHMQDISEILADTKLTIKFAAQLGLYLKNQVSNPGGHDGVRALQGMLRNELQTEGKGTAEAPKVETQVEDLWRAQGGMANLPLGTDIGVIQDTRPHPNMLNLMEYLIRDISWGVGVSPDLLWSIKDLGGANSRIANADLDRWIACRLLTLRAWLKRFRAIWISHEMKAGRLPEPAGSAQFWKCAMIPQASITADKGKVGRLNIELVRNRMRSLQTHFAEEGLDWETELRQIAHEQDTMRELNLVLEDLTQGRNRAA